jgi:hypothetical protein
VKAKHQDRGRHSAMAPEIAFQLQVFAAKQSVRRSYSGNLKTKEQLWLKETWDTMLPYI